MRSRARTQEAEDNDHDQSNTGREKYRSGHQSAQAAAFVAPFTIAYLVLFIYPTAKMLQLRFTDAQLIGRGSLGHVYRGIHYDVVAGLRPWAPGRAARRPAFGAPGRPQRGDRLECRVAEAKTYFPPHRCG